VSEKVNFWKLLEQDFSQARRPSSIYIIQQYIPQQQLTATEICRPT